MSWKKRCPQCGGRCCGNAIYLNSPKTEFYDGEKKVHWYRIATSTKMLCRECGIQLEYKTLSTKTIVTIILAGVVFFVGGTVLLDLMSSIVSVQTYKTIRSIFTFFVAASPAFVTNWLREYVIKENCELDT